MLRITGGRVYDPANGIDGVVRDVCIADGKIVADVEGGRTLNAAGMVIFPGGADIHTHVAGGAPHFAPAPTPRKPGPARPIRAQGERRPPSGRASPPPPPPPTSLIHSPCLT